VTPRLVITPGEPAGIGPDLAVRIAQARQDVELVAVADPDMLAQRAEAIGLSLDLTPVDYNAPPAPNGPGQLKIDAQPLAAPAVAGMLDPANAAYVLTCLNIAVDRCRTGQADGMVTGPVHKAVINEAGHAFTGHTGYLADRCGAPTPVMMLATDTGDMRVALATVHIPLSAVPAAIDEPQLAYVLDTVDAQLRQRFGITRPRILVAGLNPHAGENGYLGHEDDAVIAPAIAAACKRGIDAQGPLPADTLFTPHHLAQADAIVAMYHDQGLPVIKHAAFSRTVNISLGLPIVRTSVDHGTALSLAATDGVDTGSMQAAIRVARDMARHGA
tara:strand:+ start:2492 stop:3481 length:990 start_codon:yes stop_codon:yes gene_type:complete